MKYSMLFMLFLLGCSTSSKKEEIKTQVVTYECYEKEPEVLIPTIECNGKVIPAIDIQDWGNEWMLIDFYGKLQTFEKSACKKITK